MKALITKVEYVAPIETKYGTKHKFYIHYDGKKADYLANKESQNHFIANQEAEFIETSREYNGSTYYNVKAPAKTGGNSNFSRQLKKEQSKYSGFAMSYAKDLVVAGKIQESQMFAAAKKMMDWMVEQDKALENGE